MKNQNSIFERKPWAPNGEPPVAGAGFTNLPDLMAALDRPFGGKPKAVAIENPIENVTIGEIDAQVNPRLTKEVKAAAAAVTQISPETFSAIGIWSCFTPTINYQHPELREKIVGLQKGYDEAMATAMAHIPRAASDAHRAYIQECEETASQTGSVAHATGRTREDFELEYAHKFGLAIKASKTFSGLAREVVIPHIRKYVSMVRELADQMAGEEQRRYSFMGLPWKVSPLVATLYRAAEIIEQNNGAGHDPKTVARFLDLNAEPTERITLAKPDSEQPANL